MKTHFEHLLEVIPDLSKRYVLDLGAGRGRFLVELAKRQVRAVGLESSPNYISLSQERAAEQKVAISVVQGFGESLPFANSEFDFINLCEVIEHVREPREVMLEVFRVLKPGGLVYVSVPNRFGFKDQHFNLYFVNWLPRRWAVSFIGFFDKHKSYDRPEIGFQRLDEMHYFTFNQAARLFADCGFLSSDIREIKIKNKFKLPLRLPVLWFYRFLRFWYFDSAHFLLSKTD